MFFLHAVLTVGAFMFARILVPETRGLSLEAVEALWVKRATGSTPRGPDAAAAVPVA